MKISTGVPSNRTIRIQCLTYPLSYKMSPGDHYIALSAYLLSVAVPPIG